MMGGAREFGGLSPTGHAYDARRRQLELVTDPAKRDEFIAQEVDELEEMIREGFDRILKDTSKNFQEIRADYNQAIDRLREDQRIQNEHTSKRIAAIQATLIGAMASTTIAAIVGTLNLIA